MKLRICEIHRILVGTGIASDKSWFKKNFTVVLDITRKSKPGWWIVSKCVKILCKP